jgi:hypothetical protein
MRPRVLLALGLSLALFYLTGCCHPSVTAVSLEECHYGRESGIPFYMPKPLLIVAKNFRNIEEAKTGLTDSAPIPNYFDDQAKYADVNARTSWVPPGATPSGTVVAPGTGGPTGNMTADWASKSSPTIFSPHGAPLTPGAAPPDGLTPDTFYTYQIVFVPDLTQKYGLRIKGGVGEIRAAMNLVNGWQFTGLGPYYMKDSSTAQDTLASGIAANLALSGVSDVVQGIAKVGSAAGKEGATVSAGQAREIIERVEMLNPHPVARLDGYAEIHVYEPYLTSDCQMEWREITNLSFYRDYLGLSRERRTVVTDTKAPVTSSKGKEGAVVAEKPHAGQEGATVPAAGPCPPTQVNVNLCGQPGACGPVCCDKHPVLQRVLDYCCAPKPRHQIVQRVVDADVQALGDTTVQKSLTNPVVTGAVNPQKVDLVVPPAPVAPAVPPAPPAGFPLLGPPLTPAR